MLNQFSPTPPPSSASYWCYCTSEINETRRGEVSQWKTKPRERGRGRIPWFITFKETDSRQLLCSTKSGWKRYSLHQSCWENVQQDGVHANGEASCSIQLWLSFPRENALASRSSTFKLLVNFYCDSCISHNDLKYAVYVHSVYILKTYLGPGVWKLMIQTCISEGSSWQLMCVKLN